MERVTETKGGIMDLPVAKIDLGDGDYAVVVKDLLHRTVRAINEYYKPFRNPDGSVDQSKIDDDEEFILIAKLQMKEWSFGPIEVASLADIPERKLQILREEILKLYSPLAVKPAKT